MEDRLGYADLIFDSVLSRNLTLIGHRRENRRKTKENLWDALDFSLVLLLASRRRCSTSRPSSMLPVSVPSVITNWNFGRLHTKCNTKDERALLLRLKVLRLWLGVPLSRPWVGRPFRGTNRRPWTKSLPFVDEGDEPPARIFDIVVSL